MLRFIRFPPKKNLKTEKRMAEYPPFTELEVYCKATECGIGDKLYASVLIGDLQEAAEQSSYTLGYGTDFLKENNICWIILRMHIEIDRLPEWHERLKIRTWATGLEKIYYGREFEIYDSEGNRIGKASSTWILADWNTHRPVIANKRPELPPAVVQSPEFVFGESCPKISFPDKSVIAEASDKPVIKKYADYTELDRNRHVNNSRYTAWAYDALFKSGYDVSAVRSISIMYNSEVKQGEKVELYIAETNGKIAVYGYKDEDTKVFAAELSLG